MNRNKRRVRDQIAVGGEERTREIQALLDVRANGSLLE